MKKVYRARHNRMVAGVCMGLSDYFDVDVTLVRLVWVLAVLFGGSGLLAYLIAWIIIPEEPLVDGHIIEAKSDNKGRISADSRTDYHRHWPVFLAAQLLSLLICPSSLAADSGFYRGDPDFRLVAW